MSIAKDVLMPPTAARVHADATAEVARRVQAMANLAIVELDRRERDHPGTVWDFDATIADLSRDVAHWRSVEMAAQKLALHTALRNIGGAS